MTAKCIRISNFTRSIVRFATLAVVTVVTLTNNPVHSAPGPRCEDSVPIVKELSYGSRYSNESEMKDVIVVPKSQAVDRALEDVDDFIRELAREANRATQGDRSSSIHATCALEMLEAWTGADNLAFLATDNVRMTIGARLAGIALAYSQVAEAASFEQRTAISGWLARRLVEQIEFWETEAPQGARRGNLKAWIALAAIVGGREAGDKHLIDWGRSEVRQILCSVDPDGAMPREMERGSRALHYQLHALNAVAASVATLVELGHDERDLCFGGLLRAVWFVVHDIEAKGELSAKKSGKSQVYFAGDDELRPHHVAFGAAYLAICQDREFARWLAPHAVLNNSTLGVKQQVLWYRRLPTRSRPA